jgi:hypothetical protein
MEQGEFRGLPMAAKDLASCAVDVAQHIGAGVGRITQHSARQGALEAGYSVDTRGRIGCRFDHDFHTRVPHWCAPKAV